ncbi:MAG: hypothetical protein HKO68_10145 [Desulfobacterales bacterium]|nr:hypothetical protein [Deltaproteobacteria bacterium]NNL76682.1 hypothetical protein [Desulfobacterales bacterium]
MDHLTIFPRKLIAPSGLISEKFLSLGISSFLDACQYVHGLPYGYNSAREDIMILFKENMGTCTTKHAVIATLAEELNIPVYKNIGIYAMTEDIVTGTNLILEKFQLPYIPMLHCFLEYGDCRVDLTEGNQNGKNTSIEQFLYTERVIANISDKEEYQLFRRVLTQDLLKRDQLKGIKTATILHAREEGLIVLKANVGNEP